MEDGTLPQLHDQFAEVFAFEQTDESARGILEAIDDGLAVFDLAGGYPALQLADRLRPDLRRIRADETLEKDSLEQEQAKIRNAPRLGGIIVGDQAAQGNAREVVETREHGLQYIAAYILEIDIDTVGRGGFQVLRQIGAAVVDAGVEAEF